MGTRIELQGLLESILGSRNVYFQPPASVKMEYPCIVYSRSSENVKYANDVSYLRKKRYSITVMDTNPDSIIPESIAELRLCTFERHFTKDNLNHEIYNLYY